MILLNSKNNLNKFKNNVKQLQINIKSLNKINKIYKKNYKSNN